MRPSGHLPRPIRAVLAGVVHGTLEWLPVSSSGHVALLVHAAGWPEADGDARGLRTLEVALHTGSLPPIAARVLADARTVAPQRPRGGARPHTSSHEPWRPAAHLLVSGVGATAVTSVIGAIVGPAIERRADGPASVAVGLVAGSGLLLLSELRAQGSKELADCHRRETALLGLSQAAALWPGVSRRAATLAAGRALGFSPAAADALSWSAALPTLVGATVWQGWRDRSELRRRWPSVAAGIAASCATGAATRRLPAATRAWPARRWAAWRLVLAAATARRAR